VFELESFERTSIDRVWVTFEADAVSDEVQGELFRLGAKVVRLLRGAP
jgi:hypothetical protein